MFRNTLYNLMGLGLPLLFAIVTIPALIDSLGIDRFGILALIWALVSYFGLFDLGLGRALTQQLAEAWARGEEEKAARLVSTGLGVMAVMGVLAGAVLALLAEWSVSQLSGVTDNRETVIAVYAMSAAMPFILVASGLRGALEARQSFGLVNIVRLPLGIYTFLAPLAVIHYWANDLGFVAAGLTLGRIIACFAYAWLCRRSVPDSSKLYRIDRALLKGLMRSGGWMTVSNIISPLMGYLDRFVIGLVISVSAVAYYATPYEIVTKLWIIPGALMAVLFPRFAQAAVRGSDNAENLMRNGVLSLFLLLYPVTLGIALFARELITFWLDPEFARQSYPLLQLFTFGILVNCLAHVPFTLLQGVGRADLTARIHVMELPVFVLLLWTGAQTLGLLGVALAWLLRMLADTLLMFYYAMIELTGGVKEFINVKLFLLTLITIASFTGLYVGSSFVRLFIWLISILVSYLYCWHVVFGPAERENLLGRIRDAAG